VAVQDGLECLAANAAKPVDADAHRMVIMASRQVRSEKARRQRRLPNRTQMIWSGLTLLVLLGLLVSTCAVPAGP
jgi:hypothetical protein